MVYRVILAFSYRGKVTLDKKKKKNLIPLQGTKKQYLLYPPRDTHRKKEIFGINPFSVVTCGIDYLIQQWSQRGWRTVWQKIREKKPAKEK